MNKVLIAVDDRKASLGAIDIFHKVFSPRPPQIVALLYVEKIEGRSLMDDMLGEAELSTLKEELKGTRYQQRLDERAEKVLDHFKKVLEQKGVTGIETIVREGHPAVEIIAAAREEKVDLIIIGSGSAKSHSVLMGSVSREVANGAGTSVLIAKPGLPE